MRFAAMLAGRFCNPQQIFNQQRPQGDLFKTQFRIISGSISLTWFNSRAGRFSNTSPAASRRRWLLAKKIHETISGYYILVSDYVLH